MNRVLRFSAILEMDKEQHKISFNDTPLKLDVSGKDLTIGQEKGLGTKRPIKYFLENHTMFALTT